MVEAAHALPSLREELNRKTFETIEWLFSGVEKGRLTEQEFSVAIDALFMAVSGLVGQEFLEMFSAADAECKGIKRVQKRHFHAPADDKIVTLSWVPGEARITTTERVSGIAVGGKVTDYDSAQFAAQLFKTVETSFEKKGWIEL